jgi:hypothetical protein
MNTGGLLRERLQPYLSRQAGAGILVPLVFPAEPKLTLVCEEALRRLSDKIGTITPLDMDAITERLHIAASHDTWQEISARDWLYAAECLWRGDAPHLASKPAFQRAYAVQLQQRGNLVRRLIRVYCSRFEVALAGFLEIAALIRENLAHPMVREWRQRHQTLDIFTPEAALQRLAQHLEAEQGSLPQALKSLGLPRGGRLGNACFHECLNRLYRRLSDGTADTFLPRMLEWMARIFSESAASHLDKHAAECLLLPWANGKTPDEETKDSIQRFLLEHYEDPRLHPHGRWFTVDEAAKSVLRRWLAQASLLQFFQIIDRNPRDEAEKRQWKYRRAFWQSYFDAGHIQEVWVALSREAFTTTKHLATTSGDPSFGNCAELSGSGIKPNHAVLLLKIGDLIIADWNFSGTCRLWSHNREEAPRLYASTYTYSELVELGDEEYRHYGIDKGNWQQKVADYIYERTGILMKPNDYMPREQY